MPNSEKILKLATVCVESVVTVVFNYLLHSFLIYSLVFSVIQLSQNCQYLPIINTCKIKLLTDVIKLQ